jgi:hypothetical protein
MISIYALTIKQGLQKEKWLGKRRSHMERKWLHMRTTITAGQGPGEMGLGNHVRYTYIACCEPNFISHHRT